MAPPPAAIAESNTLRVVTGRSNGREDSMPAPARRLPALALLTLLTALLLAGSAGAAGNRENDQAPRTPDGKPDLTGTYDASTLTPLSRPPQFGDNLYLTPEEAEKIEKTARELRALTSQNSNPDREAPDVGGARSFGLEGAPANPLEAAAGNVGGYNSFWLDQGDSVLTVDGQFRTSIITEPKNGQQPPLTPDAMRRMRQLYDQFHPNDGTAFWLEWDRPGPYDDIEVRPLPERCLLTYSTAVPVLPSIYNNTQRIVQTGDEVMILTEMVHDVRVVRLHSQHLPAEMKFWLGDSIGWWEGDTLVVETTNFKSEPGGYYYGPVDRLKVIERFTRWNQKTLHYAFEVENPERWTGPWKGDLTWTSIDGEPNGRVFEYACHEGNYAMGNIMRGARLLEREARESSSD